MKKRLIFITGILLAFIPVLSIAQTSDTEALKYLNKKWLNAIVERDTTALSNILADDFVLINPGGVKRNKKENLSGILSQNQKVMSVDIDSEEVRLLSPEVGLVTAWTINKVIADGKQSVFRICYQDVYMKRKNKWRAVAAHVTLLN